MKKATKNVLIAVVLLLAAFLYYYITIPAINIHSVGTWWFIIIGTVVITLLLSAKKAWKDNNKVKIGKGIVLVDIKSTGIAKIGFLITGVLLIILAVGAFLSSPIINARKYQKLMTVPPPPAPPASLAQHAPRPHYVRPRTPPPSGSPPRLWPLLYPRYPCHFSCNQTLFCKVQFS